MNEAQWNTVARRPRRVSHRDHSAGRRFAASERHSRVWRLSCRVLPTFRDLFGVGLDKACVRDAGLSAPTHWNPDTVNAVDLAN